jgi:U3 small nucleolar RNA-associated protein 20
VASVAVDRMLNHLRRGKAEPFWDILQAEASRRAVEYEAAAAAAATSSTSATKGAAAGAAAAGLGRAVALVAQAVSYYRGSRVESYKPLLELLARLMRPTMWPASPAAQGSSGGERVEGSELMSEGGVLGSSSKEPHVRVSLSEQTLGLALAVVYGHGKVCQVVGSLYCVCFRARRMFQMFRVEG